jgi:hypothetical protein
MFRNIDLNNSVVKILDSIINTCSVADIDRGISKKEFIDQKLPNTNLDWHDMKEGSFITIINIKDKKLAACAKLLNATECTNSIMYYSNSFMKWHTNSDNPGKRIYYTYTLGEACFRYIDADGNDIVDYDNIGWTAREFEIPKEGYLWHTIWSNKPRYAFGFNQK